MTTPAFKDTATYWDVLSCENQITLSDLVRIMFQYRDPDSNTILEDRDPYEAIREEYGANAFYFSLPDEFDEYMDFEIENACEEYREILERFFNSLSK